MRKALVEARGNKSQVNVSAEIGISQKYLSKLELGQRTPSMRIAIKLSSYYKTDLEKLFPDIYGKSEYDLLTESTTNQTTIEQNKQMTVFDL